MRRSALSCTFARCLLTVLVIATTVAEVARAQEVSSPAGGQVETTATGGADGSPSGGSPSKEDAQRVRREQLLRRGTTYLGPVGGIHVVEAGSGAPRSFRLQLLTDFFYKKDYLYNDDQNRYVAGSVALSFTPIDHLELSGAVTARSLRNSVAETERVLSIGDPFVDVKGYGEVAPGVTLGGDVLVSFLTKGEGENDEVAFAGASVGLRANLSLDLRRMPAEVPLELRFNGGYYFDQSNNVVDDLEDARFARLNPPPVGETSAHLARREERLVYGVNRVDHATLALGLEAPLKLSKRVALHPIAEWEWWIPVNRQDYDCLVLRRQDGSRVSGQDGCLADEGFDTWPQRLTAGFRLYPAAGGFSLIAAVEVGVGGTTHFVRELAPTAPYRVYAGASYVVDYDPKPEVTVVKEVEKRVEVPVAPKEGRVRGRVVEQGAGTPIANARVTFSGRGLSPILSNTTGEFVSYEFPPGAVGMDLEADGYRPGSCSAQIPETGGDVQATCELAALPRVGSVEFRVFDGSGAAATAIPLALSGPDNRTATTDVSGIARVSDLPPGDYQVRVDHPSFLVAVLWAHVEARKDTVVEIRLSPKPAKPLVTVQANKLALKGTILFNTNTAELDPRSEPLVAEIADVLIRAPEILSVEIRGHTDAVGTPEYNLDLSQRRADTVKDRLARLGVDASRLTAKGFGATKPVAPNISERNRARNRRVEFAIVERAPGAGATPAGGGAAAPARAPATPPKP